MSPPPAVRTHAKPGTRRDWATALRQDIRDFKKANGLERVIMLNCASTEVYIERGPGFACALGLPPALTPRRAMSAHRIPCLRSIRWPSLRVCE